MDGSVVNWSREFGLDTRLTVPQMLEVESWGSSSRGPGRYMVETPLKGLGGDFVGSLL